MLVRYIPDTHDVHWELAAVVQVSALVHPGTGVQDVHTVGIVLERQ